MPLETTVFDASRYLETSEDMAVFLQDAFESGEPGVVSDAIGVIARAKGMTELARETGLSRQSLYRALSAEGRPEFGTVLKVLAALGVKLQPTPTVPSGQELKRA